MKRLCPNPLICSQLFYPEPKRIGTQTMIIQSKPLSTVVPLTDVMHNQAEHVCPSYLNLADSESMYLNVLAIAAVDHYLKRLGYGTHYQTEALTNPVLQAFLDVAPIELLAPLSNEAEGSTTPQSYGLLECRRVMPNDHIMSIPDAAIHAGRLAYIAVQFNDDLSKVHLLGYVSEADTEVGTEKIPLNALRSLDELCEYLKQLKPERFSMSQVINLRQWFDAVFPLDWKAIASVLQFQQIEAQFHQTQMVPARIRKRTTERIERGCVISLGHQGLQVSMVMSIEKISTYQYSVGVEFWPTEGKYLPDGLQLSILDDQDQTVLEAQTRDDHQKLELKFEGETNDCFSVRIGTSDMSVTKQFML